MCVSAVVSLFQYCKLETLCLRVEMGQCYYFDNGLMAPAIALIGPAPSVSFDQLAP